MGRHIIMIGIGQSGCMAADLFSHKMNKDGLHVSAFAIDTDERTLSGLEHASPIPMVDSRSLNSVVEALGAENIESWFPCVWEEDKSEFVRHLDMNQGSNQWRMKAMMSFASFLSKEKLVDKLHLAIDESVGAEEEEKEIELYYVASLAGGTGSGLYLPIAFYLKKYIESKGLKIKISKAMLLMPDIYDNCFTVEQKTKSYANAYAALREYNAVLACTENSDAKGSESKHPPVIFKIGSENGVPGVLFDSENKEFHSPEVNPFDNVYLFERIPGILSVGEHVEVVSDVVISMCNRTEKQTDDKLNSKSPDAVFGGISLIKVRYPIDSIVEYISKKQLHDCVSVELCHVHKAVMAELERRRGEAKLYGFIFTEDIDQYCDAYVSVCEDIVGISGTSLSLINRDPKVYENDPSAEDIWNVKYLQQLTSLADESFDCESARTLHNIVFPPVVKKKPDEKGKKKENVRKVNLSGKKLADFAGNCGEMLLDWYRKGMRSIVCGKQDFLDSLTPEVVTEDKFSLLNNILFRDGEYIHPVYALLRLCLVYKELSTYCKNVGTESYNAEDIDNLQIPFKITNAESIFGGKTKYSKGGESRFRQLALNQNTSGRKIADDDSLFRYDLEQVYTRLRKKLRAYRYMDVLESLEETIEKYRRFIRIMWKCNDDIFEEMRLALRNNSIDNGNIVNVGASEIEKTEIYNAYFELYRKDTDAIVEYTKLMGKSIYSVLRRHNTDESVRGAVMEVLNDASELFAKHCRESDFYQENLVKNIYTAISESRAKKGTGLTLSKVFKGRNPYVRVKMPDAFSEYSSVKTSTTAIFDKNIEDFIDNNVIDDNRSTAKEHLERLMYEAGEYCGEAEFVSYVADREMLLQTETNNLRLYYVNTVNELDVEKIGYKSYLLALQKTFALNTQMWNPHLIYTRGEAPQMPFINPEMQTRYERDVAKAVVFALWEGEMKVDNVEEVENVYVVHAGDGYEPIIRRDAYISAKRPDLMMIWAYGNRSWVKTNADKFDKLVAEEIETIPSQRDGYNNKFAVDRAVSASAVMEILKTQVLPLIFALRNGGGDDCGFEISLAEVFNKTILEYCNRAYSCRMDENFIGLFNKQMGICRDAFVEQYGEEAQGLVSWLNSLGYFNPLAFMS